MSEHWKKRKDELRWALEENKKAEKRIKEAMKSDIAHRKKELADVLGQKSSIKRKLKSINKRLRKGRKK